MDNSLVMLMLLVTGHILILVIEANEEHIQRTDFEHLGNQTRTRPKGNPKPCLSDMAFCKPITDGLLGDVQHLCNLSLGVSIGRHSQSFWQCLGTFLGAFRPAPC